MNSHLRRLVCVSALLALAASGGCAGMGGASHRGKAGPSRLSQLTKTPEMEKSFQAADKIYYARQWADAKAAFQAYLDGYPYNALTPKAYFRLGEIAFAEKDFEKAIGYYKKARERGIHPEWGSYAIYKQAVAHAGLEQNEKVLSVLDLIPRQGTDKKVAIRAASLRVATARKIPDPVAEKQGFLEAIDAYEGLQPGEAKVGDLNWMIGEKAAKDELRAWIALETPEEGDLGNPNRLKSLWDRFDGKTSGGYLAWKLARLYDQKGDYKKSAEWAQRYAMGYPKGEYMPKARALLAELEKRGATAGPLPEEKRGYVGILLPLTGKYAVYGESVLHGLECAAGIFSPCRGDLGLNLLVRDTQGDPKTAAKIVAEFAANPDVRAVIGPLPQVEVDQAATAAETSQIPMITLSQKADVARQGQFIFRNFLTVADQVASLVDYACGEKKWKKLAILYPSGPAGEEYRKSFEDEVAHCGGKLVAQASYPSDTKNFSDAVRSLKFSGTDQSADTAISADALFLPDVYRKVPSVIDAMKSLGVQGVRLMGGAGWGQPGLLNAGAEALEGAVYVNGFFSQSSSFAVRDFVATFQAAYGFEPTILEAYAFDTMRLLGEVLRDNPTSGRPELQAALAKKRNFSGVTGNISFDDEGDARRRLSVLSIEHGEIREVQ
ncbi:MAG TPA: penicillin-binding protein activator [bacterium]|nr:penicillin-binding protein activator [bacterium]